MAKQGQKKAKAVREGGAVKGGTDLGRGKRVPTQPPGMPSGKHHAALASKGLCDCGRCSNDRLGKLFAVGAVKRK